MKHQISDIIQVALLDVWPGDVIHVHDWFGLQIWQAERDGRLKRVWDDRRIAPVGVDPFR